MISKQQIRERVSQAEEIRQRGVRLKHVIRRLKALGIFDEQFIIEHIGTSEETFERYLNLPSENFINHVLTVLHDRGVDSVCIEFVSNGVSAIGTYGKCHTFDYEMHTDEDRELLRRISDTLFEQSNSKRKATLH